jgi:hypothetical protein
MEELFKRKLLVRAWRILENTLLLLGRVTAEEREWEI